MTDYFPRWPGPSVFTMTPNTSVDGNLAHSMRFQRRASYAHRYLFQSGYGLLTREDDKVMTGFALARQADAETFYLELAKPYDRSRIGQNLIEWSEDFTRDPPWNVTGVPVITPNTDVAPDGTTTATTIEDNRTDGIDGVTYDLTIDAADDRWHSLSVFIKKDADQTRCPGILVHYFDGPPQGNTSIVINTATGEVDAAGNLKCFFGCIDYDANWWRVWCSAKDPGVNPTLRLRLRPAYVIGSDPSGDRVDEAVGSAVFWGAQFERALSPGPYYPTAQPMSETHKQWGARIDTYNWVPKAQRILARGDHVAFEFNDKLYRINADIYSDAAGRATLTFDPPTISTVSADSAVYGPSNLKARVSLADLQAVEQPARSNPQFSRNVAYSFIEDLTL